MVRRCAALALTLMVFGTPVAMAVCEAMCAQGDAASAMGDGHRCCHGPSSGRTAAIGAVMPLCDHEADTPPGTEQPQQPAGAPAIGVAPFVPPAECGVRERHPQSRWPASVPPAITAPLRI